MASRLFKAVEPREDVLEGTLSDAIFAASLDEVVAGTAPAVYGDPETFFAGTHVGRATDAPRRGARPRRGRQAGRAIGDPSRDEPRRRQDAQPDRAVPRRARRAAARGRVKEFMTAKLSPSSRSSSSRSSSARRPGDRVPRGRRRRRADALGLPRAPARRRGHLLLRRRRRRGVDGAGSDALKQVLGGGSSLILIDELARYLETASGVRSATHPRPPDGLVPDGADGGRRRASRAPASSSRRRR